MESIKNPYVAFYRGTSPIKFELDIKYTYKDVEDIFGSLPHEYYYGLLYCDKIQNKDYCCKVTKSFDYDNKKIILTIGDKIK